MFRPSGYFKKEKKPQRFDHLVAMCFTFSIGNLTERIKPVFAEDNENHQHILELSSYQDSDTLIKKIFFWS